MLRHYRMVPVGYGMNERFTTAILNGGDAEAAQDAKGDLF